MRILINSAFGGFGLSRAALDRLRELVGQSTFDQYGADRHNPLLLQVFDEMGQGAAGSFCKLKVVEIPDDVDYEIEEYDGAEWVAEKHRTWR